MLSERGVAGVTVEGLARSLGIAKAGFYWHFRDREDLLHQLLDFWSHELTEVVTNNHPLIELEPRERLERIAEMILEYDLTRYEIPIHQWALQNAGAARVVRRVTRMRLDLVRQAISELGFEGDDLEMRAMLFVVYQSWESPMFPAMSLKRRRGLIAARIDLLIR